MSLLPFFFYMAVDRIGNEEGTTKRKGHGLLCLPAGVIKEVLSFLPATITVRVMTFVAPRFAYITRSDIHWMSVWNAYINECTSRYTQSGPLSHRKGRLEMLCANGKSYSGPIILLASVPKRALPNTRVTSRGSGKIALVEWRDDPNSEKEGEKCDCVVHLILPIRSLPSLSGSPVIASTERMAALRISRVEDREGNEVDHPNDGEHNSLGVGVCDTMLLRKALCFLHGNNSNMLFIRPMIDGLHAVRLLFFSSKQSSLDRREGTTEEQEATTVEFINAVAYALECCTSRKALAPAGTARLATLYLETGSESVFTIGNDAATVAENAIAVEAAETASGGSNDGIFFSLFDSQPSDKPEAGANGLRYSSVSTQVYLFLLQHVSFSDVHVHVLENERKCAVCSRVLSPTGRAVEFRFFYSLFLGGYPRFFAKMVFAEADLPRTRIQQVFERNCSRYVPTSATDYSSNEEDENEEETLPMLCNSFCGGYGRVEVDIKPTISRDGFERLREALGLSAAALPMPMLWNVVMLATGVGGVVLREQQSCFASYYRTSFAAAFEQEFESS